MIEGASANECFVCETNFNRFDLYLGYRFDRRVFAPWPLNMQQIQRVKRRMDNSLRGGSREVDWVASHPPLWGRLNNEIKKGNKTITEAIFVSDCSDIILSGQPPTFKNYGSTTVIVSIKRVIVSLARQRLSEKKSHTAYNFNLKLGLILGSGR